MHKLMSITVLLCCGLLWNVSASAQTASAISGTSACKKATTSCASKAATCKLKADIYGTQAPEGARADATVTTEAKATFASYSEKSATNALKVPGNCKPINCDPSNCDVTNCDPSNCDISNCDLKNLPPACKLLCTKKASTSGVAIAEAKPQ